MSNFKKSASEKKPVVNVGNKASKGRFRRVRTNPVGPKPLNKNYYGMAGFPSATPSEAVDPEKQFDELEALKHSLFDKIHEAELIEQKKQKSDEAKQAKLVDKLQEDVKFVWGLLEEAYLEESISYYITRGSDIVQIYVAEQIVEPATRTTYKKNGEGEETYLEGHDPFIRVENSHKNDKGVVGFIKGDDQLRITGSREIQEKYESWVYPEFRGQGLELMAINRAVAAKIKRVQESVYNFNHGTFEAIVWDGNKPMALDLLREGWTPVIPGEKDFQNENSEKFHLFTKTFTFENQ